MQPHERIILALDVPTDADALRLAGHTRDHVFGYKVGLRLITRYGRPFVENLVNLGKPVMYDGKFHDIPNTVGDATREAASLGVWGFTLHASGGTSMVAEAVANKGSALALGVTVLTSMTEIEQLRSYNVRADIKVPEFAIILFEAGADGIVCSPLELERIKSVPKLRSLKTVIPGIRPAGADKGDQARSATPAFAIEHGADYLVIGRPIYDAANPVDACKRIVDEIAEALEHDTEPAPPVAEDDKTPLTGEVIS